MSHPSRLSVRCSLALASILLAWFLILGAAGPTVATELAVEGTRFTIDGKPTFLLGISYYGALGASEEFIRSDLDDMRQRGINWIRVWATWGAFGNDVTAVDEKGDAREPYMSRLRWLVAECDRRGMIVDITLSRGNGVVGAPRLQSLSVHRRAAETIVSTLQPHRNWYLDLGNERNIGDKRFVPFEELKRLREAVRKLDPRRLVTASHAGDIALDDLRRYLLAVGVDFVSPHRPRNSRSANETESRTRQYLAQLQQLGRSIPLHYQEPFRRGFSQGWEPKVYDFLTDVEGARRGGAAGWCLHNGDQRHQPGGQPCRSFDMRKRRLFDQLDKVERHVVDSLQRTLTTDEEPKP
ncbi:MAG: hypothetical protein JXB62_16575 [Pirellulales bacterium]|nr:hypothetical protein [Pirellulales bacterium]